MRVHELAKSLGLSSKDLAERLKKLHVEVKSHMAVLDEAVCEKVRKSLAAPAKAVPSARPAAKRPESPPSAPQPARREAPAHPVKAVPAPASAKAAPSAPAAPAKPAPVQAPRPVPAPAKPAPVAEAPKPAPPGEPLRPAAPPPRAAEKEEVLKIAPPISVGELAGALGVTVAQLIKGLIGMGIFANVNQLVDEAIVLKVAQGLGKKVKTSTAEAEGTARHQMRQEDAKHLVLRPPVVTLMGHVDHGKTSLLDAIRKTNVADREAGRITQHIGAYGVELPGKGHVTFLDTPGHEAFTSMRARGANVTDVVVLVVAADDGVMPQTVEAIDHARAAGVPIVVAINKSDLPTAKPDRVKAQLQKLDITTEDWGGKTIMVPVSAKTGKGIDELLEMLLLEAEVLELKANPRRAAEGTVIEARLTRDKGPEVTVLVQDGTLSLRDVLVCGPFYGKIRAMHNDRGKAVKEVPPGHAASVLGLSGVPDAGCAFQVLADVEGGRRLADRNQMQLRERSLAGQLRGHLRLDDLHSKIAKGEIKELKLIIKADVQGSLEALRQAIEKLSTLGIKINILHGAGGGINESDVMLAAASDAIVIGFHVKPNEKAEELIEKEKVDVRYYNIIFDVVESIKKAMQGLLEPQERESTQGRVEVRKIFHSSKVGTIGGAVVIKGVVARSHRVRLVRDNVVVYDGRLKSLRRFKDDVREVQEGYECGIALENFDDLKERDVLEAYKVEKLAATL